MKISYVSISSMMKENWGELDYVAH